jgi:hypothetical protein
VRQTKLGQTVEVGISEIRPSPDERFNEQATGGGNENTPNQNSLLTSFLDRRKVDSAETVSTLSQIQNLTVSLFPTASGIA